MKTLFGPVPSRRFGRSLGIDLFTKKTCTFNCIYCEVGEGKPVSSLENGWVSADSVVREVSGYLVANTENPPDFITFAGSGEPTLYPEIDRIIDGIHHVSTIPVVLLTNGSLLHHETVRERILRTDYLVPSLDAGCEETFLRINRPVKDVSYEQLLRGLRETRQAYTGHYLLEVLLVDGVNTSDREMEMLVARIREIQPDGVQINTVFRPPADGKARPADEQTIARFAEMVGPPATPVKYYQQQDGTHYLKGALLEAVILKTLGIRPCTVVELTNSLGVPDRVMERALTRLKRSAKVGERIHGNEVFLTVTKPDSD